VNSTKAAQDRGTAAQAGKGRLDHHQRRREKKGLLLTALCQCTVWQAAPAAPCLVLGTTRARIPRGTLGVPFSSLSHAVDCTLVRPRVSATCGIRGEGRERRGQLGMKCAPIRRAHRMQQRAQQRVPLPSSSFHRPRDHLEGQRPPPPQSPRSALALAVACRLPHAPQRRRPRGAPSASRPPVS
jgi:hypothetical protein